MKYQKREQKNLEEVVEDIVEKEQEITESYEDELEDSIDEALDQDKKIKRAKLIINIIFAIIVVLIIMVATDIICVSRFNKGPFFAIPTKTYKDGGTKEYKGLGYKVIKYKQLQGRRDTVIGNWSIKYDIKPITTKDVDMAIEFSDNSAKSYEKYYKKFVRIITTLHKVDKKNNTILVGYEDEGGKYSLEIECTINKDERKDVINKFKTDKAITIIGTVSDFSPKTNKSANKIYISDCFAEQ